MWRVAPLQNYRTLDHDVSPRGEGNAVSIEFNLMYRWHACISAPDTTWLEGELGALFPEKKDDLASVTKADFGRVYSRLKAPADVRNWTFGG